MEAATAPSAEEFEALKAALASMRNERDEARAEVAVAKAERSEDQALIAHLKLMIAKLKRETFGVSSERSSRLLDQMELQLEELEASATEDELAAEKAAPRTKKPDRPHRTPAESAGRRSSSTKTSATKITRVRNWRRR